MKIKCKATDCIESDHTPTRLKAIAGALFSYYRVRTLTADDALRYSKDLLGAVNKYEALLKAAKYFEQKYSEFMLSEFSYPDDNWSYARDNDTASLKHLNSIAKAEGK